MKRRIASHTDSAAGSLSIGCEETSLDLKNVGNETRRVLRSRTFEEKTDSEESKSPERSSLQFTTCLDSPEEISLSSIDYTSDISPRSFPTIVLRRALSINELEDESWLTSSFIDLVLTKFAKKYNSVRYLSVESVAFSLANKKGDFRPTHDILNNPINYKDKKTPIVLIFHAQNIHWNLLRVVRYPSPELQLFEPMGMPMKRGGGLSYRNVPRQIVNWLDARCPLSGDRTWLSAGISAITKQQQLTSYDCGVACLLYAEKCGMKQVSSYQSNLNIIDLSTCCLISAISIEVSTT